MSSEVPKCTSIFGNFCKIRKKSRDTKHPRPGQSAMDEHDPDIPISTRVLNESRSLHVDPPAGNEGHCAHPQRSHANFGLPPQLLDRSAKYEHNTDTSASGQPSSQHIGGVTEDRGQPDIAISSQTTLEPPKLGNKGTSNGETVRDRSPPVIPKHLSNDIGGNTAQERGTASSSFFQGSSNVQISGSSFYDVRGNATIIRFGESQFTEDQRSFISDCISNFGNLPDINSNLNRKFLTRVILELPRAEAVFDDYQTKKKNGPCFEGTRVTLLREMASWVTDPDQSGMYILSGLAGIGKSTVAYTIASRASSLNLLGASFFFSRDDADRRNAKRFFTTVAYQLCVYNETFAKVIGNVLETESGSAATTKDPQEQLQVLLLEPLRGIVQSRARPILIVIDALDECDEDDARTVLIGLSRFVRELPSFKVILTTRPQPYFDLVLNGQASQNGHQIFCLQNIEDKVVDSDIRLYLQHNLSLKEVQKNYPRRKWCANEEEIGSLVHAAGRLFIIASTAIRYILDKSASNPAAQMQKLLHALAQNQTPFKDLDYFYTVILRTVIPEQCDDDIVSRYRSVVGAIISVQHPVPISTLTHLINMDPEDIYAVLDNLRSVILLDSDDDVPRIYHKSFPDYLMDSARCKDLRLQIDPRISHIQVATYCLDIMNKHLKYNILGLGNPAQFMGNTDGLEEDGITSEQLEEKIPQQLRYACVYWANHLEVARIEDAILTKKMEMFVDKHLLHCFEVLSLIGQFDSAHRAIRVVLNLLKSTPSNVNQLLSDALRFISKFYEVIKRSALHIYHSALSFTPTDSFLYRRHYKEAAADRICTIEGGPKEWDHLVAHLIHGESVEAVKFSLDGSLFASCSKKNEEESGLPIQGKLKMWDTVTGTPISTIPGHRFAVSNDFSTIASSGDKTITFYDANGNAVGTMLTTLSKIKRLAFSSESSRVAAVLSDGTICLWDSRTAELIDSFDGSEDGAGGDGSGGTEDGSEDGAGDSENNPDGFDHDELEFSSTGTTLAYSLPDDIVKLRDGISGRLIADLQCGPSPRFAFSGDGSRITSVSLGYSLKLWNSESGGLVGTATDVGRNGKVAISTNGSLLATMDDNDNDTSIDGEVDVVTLWSESGGSLSQIEALELNSVYSAAFSSNNVLAIALAFSVKLYDANSRSFVSTLPFRGFPTVLAFSPDCTHLAVGNFSSSVSLWDVRDTHASSLPSLSEEPLKEGSLEAHTVGVTALALSQDCIQLVCGFKNGTIELWVTSPTRRRIAAHQAHQTFVRALGFGPDGGHFASGSEDETIRVWNGKDGTLYGTLETPGALRAVALSNSMLVAGHDNSNVTLWSLDTLNLIHTFKAFGDIMSRVSIAENNTLVAVVGEDSGFSKSRELGDSMGVVFINKTGQSAVSVLDVVNRTTVATFDVPRYEIVATILIPYEIHKITFLPDNSQLVAQCRQGVFLSFNLSDKRVTEGPTLEHLIQLPDLPLWRGAPIWHCWDIAGGGGGYYLSALFSRHEKPVPVLWIPQDLHVFQWTQGSSMIALGCMHGRVILLRLPTSHDH